MLLARTRGVAPARRALLTGLLTPLLPCGLLWAAFAAAAVAGSALGGGSVMIGFAAGSLPVLALAQTQASVLARRIGSRPLAFLQRGAMLLAAVMLVYRGIAGLTTGTCCH
jgi:sulfite exporter TauE/SafE